MSILMKSKMIIDEGGNKRWCNSKGKRHREDGPAIEFLNGNKAWLINGKFHREDGPAIERTDGYKAWFINDERHREDGPAIEYTGGCKVWYLNGVEYTEQEYKKKMRSKKIESLYN